MDSSTEIRKLTAKDREGLFSILDQNEQWKCLMTIIPKTLEHNTYKCRIPPKNPCKYNADQFKCLEDAADKSKRKCTEILFDEWGTSGQVRPALGHLLHLLVEAKLFRAADYVAVDLLHQEKPKRPENGPWAIIPPELMQLKSDELEFERNLDDIDYIRSAVTLIRVNSEREPNRNKVIQIPQIVITPDADVNKISGFTMPLVLEQAQNNINNNSDMIQFSSDSMTSPIIPVNVEEINTSISSTNIPVVVNPSSSSSNSSFSLADIPNIPNFDKMNELESASSESDTYTSSSSEVIGESDSFIPPINDLLDFKSSIGNASCVNIPKLTELNLNSEKGTESTLETQCSSEECMMGPAISLLQNEYKAESFNILPDLSGLGINSNIGSISLNMSSQASSNVSLQTPPCSSPLPALSLDTALPHFNYSTLLTATNNFDDNPYVGENDRGRLLGSGEFGSVFLALGLFEQSVAVKKIFLGNAEVVNVDDEVTKQFRNEVEILSKYKHDNLLSLLGFSCDGCTYCLIYDYMPGGALKDRLQVIENILQWKERLNIAVGTSRAIAYLHTAFETPLSHRDIKSANILLDSENNAKVGDFGLIKLIPNKYDAVVTMVYGTSAYMPREAFGGEVTVKLDTFSFGVVLLELITSLPPIDNNREGKDLITHIQEMIENDDIGPLVDKRAGGWEQDDVNYATKLFEISERCLQEKRKRPTMVDVKIALEELTKNLNFP
ncbi:hypothetical protein JTB14_008617 [Gonioctena quinquepunctata]|nr:hypothetical protein JTB14_008617 [Gonioctena quinquepunctata]